MPNLRNHLKISNDLLGFSDPLVHQILDYQGRNLEHRFRHNPKICESIKEMLGENEYLEAWLHILTDWGMIKWENSKTTKRQNDKTIKQRKKKTEKRIKEKTFGCQTELFGCS